MYKDGVFWQWLEEQKLLPATVGRGSERLVYRHNAKLTDALPGAEALSVLERTSAPTDASFRTWAQSNLGPEAAEVLSAFAFIVTYEVDAGRLSAAVVQECIRRTIQPDVARYFIGGWQTLIARLDDAARELGS